MEDQPTPSPSEPDPSQQTDGATKNSGDPGKEGAEKSGVMRFMTSQFKRAIQSLAETVFQPEHELRQYRFERMAILRARLIAEDWYEKYGSLANCNDDNTQKNEELKNFFEKHHYYIELCKELESALSRDSVSVQDQQDLKADCKEHFFSCILGASLTNADLRHEISYRKQVLLELVGPTFLFAEGPVISEPSEFSREGAKEKEPETGAMPPKALPNAALVKNYFSVVTWAQNAFVFSKRRDRLKTATALFVGLPFAALMVVLVSLSMYYAGDTPVLVYVIAAGLLGAYLSIILRLTKLGENESPVAAFMQITYGRSSLVFSLVIGGLTPLLGCLLLSAGHVHGTLLPEVPGLGALYYGKCKYEGNIRDYTEWVRLPLVADPDTSQPMSTNRVPCSDELRNAPTNGTSHAQKRLEKQRALFVDNSGTSGFARLLLFAFLCGWAERLIPDALDKALSRIRGK